MFNSWIDRGDELAADFRNGDPFPLLLIDDFLDEDTANKLLEEFPKPDAMPKSRDYMFGDKHELSSVAEQGPTSREFYDALMSDKFKQFISTLTGKDLFVDPAFHGGGFHQSGDGGFLDTHVDFNMHPLHEDWLRTLNILLYLNKDWKPEYDGRLLIKASPDDEPRGIEPVFNRGLLMLTDDHTFHGFKKMSLPAGVTRKSIATYAYEKVPVGSITSRTTGWSPDEGGTVKKSIAKHYNTLVRAKTKVFGSATAKNR
jgi:Rps23 Pro-64 3,4-dihydroxylase Tpa1-like proline 4-hydroxylase